MDVDPYGVSFCVCSLLESAVVFQVWALPAQRFFWFWFVFSLNSRVSRHTQMGACVGFPFVALDQFCPEDNQTFCATLMSMLMVSEYSSAMLHDCSMRK